MRGLEGPPPGCAPTVPPSLSRPNDPARVISRADTPHGAGVPRGPSSHPGARSAGRDRERQHLSEESIGYAHALKTDALSKLGVRSCRRRLAASTAASQAHLTKRRRMLTASAGDSPEPARSDYWGTIGRKCASRRAARSAGCTRGTCRPALDPRRQWSSELGVGRPRATNPGDLVP